MENVNIFAGDLFRRIDGEICEVITLSKDIETQEILITYKLQSSKETFTETHKRFVECVPRFNPLSSSQQYISSHKYRVGNRFTPIYRYCAGTNKINEVIVKALVTRNDLDICKISYLVDIYHSNGEIEEETFSELWIDNYYQKFPKRKSNDCNPKLGEIFFPLSKSSSNYNLEFIGYLTDT